MRNLLLFPLLCTSLFSACKKDTITLQVNSCGVPTMNRLNTIHFVSPTIGYAAGGIQFSEPTLVKTVDGGISWQSIDLPKNGEQKEIYGLDADINGQIITCGYGGTVFISTDSANTFRYHQHSSWKELRDVSIRSADSACIVGGIDFDMGHISAVRCDGSGNFQFYRQFNFELRDIDFIDSLRGYIAGYGAILVTHDGGQHWDFTSAKNDFFVSMCWKNSQEGIAVGYEGSIIKTEDGGEHWKTVRNGNSITTKKIHLLAVERNTNTNLIAVGEKGIALFSKDNGDTWVEIQSFTQQHLRSVSFRDPEHAFICGDNGHIFCVTE